VISENCGPFLLLLLCSLLHKFFTDEKGLKLNTFQNAIPPPPLQPVRFWSDDFPSAKRSATSKEDRNKFKDLNTLLNSAECTVPLQEKSIFVSMTKILPRTQQQVDSM
jgi:hypothetical protein